MFKTKKQDAKGQIVMQLMAVDQLLAEKKISPEDVGFLYVVGEEPDHDVKKKIIIIKKKKKLEEKKREPGGKN